MDTDSKTRLIKLICGYLTFEHTEKSTLKDVGTYSIRLDKDIDGTYSFIEISKVDYTNNNFLCLFYDFNGYSRCNILDADMDISGELNAPINSFLFDLLQDLIFPDGLDFKKV